MEVHSKYLGSVERGEQNPTLEFLTKLSAAFDVELVALFNYAWHQMTAAELKRQLHDLIDKAVLTRANLTNADLRVAIGLNPALRGAFKSRGAIVDD
jgi:transcriptional regulator with XRE-family HTH domain